MWDSKVHWAKSDKALLMCISFDRTCRHSFRSFLLLEREPIRLNYLAGCIIPGNNDSNLSQRTDPILITTTYAYITNTICFIKIKRACVEGSSIIYNFVCKWSKPHTSLFFLFRIICCNFFPCSRITEIYVLRNLSAGNCKIFICSS